MKTLPLQDIMKRYRDVLSNSVVISNWCQDTYGKQPTIFVGFNAKDPPKDDVCPSIVIFQGQKMEGDGVDTFAYQMSVGWAIINKNITTTANVREYDGVYESDTFGHLILSELANAGSYPILSVDYSLEAFSHYPQFPGRADIVIEMPHTMGGSDIITF